MPESNLISGRRPVLEALNSEIPVDRLTIRLGAKGDIIGAIISAAKSRSLRIDRLTPEIFDRKFNPKTTGGVVAFTAEVQTVELNDLLSRAESLLESPFLVILDGIEDPHNLGAIARSAEGAGCQGMIIPQRRSAPLSPAALKSSAGALMHLPIARVNNISEAINFLRREGVWIFGADMKGEDYREVEYPPEAALIIGAEGQGLSRLVKSACDKLISVPLRGKVDSLNASVTAGILLFHIADNKGKR